MRIFSFILWILAAFWMPFQAGAEPRKLGVAWVFTDDLMADPDDGWVERRDRWRTASGQISWFWGQGDDAFPGVWQNWELMLGGELITPASLKNPRPDDRPLAGLLYSELAYHVHSNDNYMRLAAGLAASGSQTGWDELVVKIHQDRYDPTDAVLEDQIGNQEWLSFRGEFARNLSLNGALLLRPFGILQTGLENLVRAGVDMLIGPNGVPMTLTRNDTTGFLIWPGKDAPVGWTGLVGGDVSFVMESDLLPEHRGYETTDFRPRLRAGAVYQGASWRGFYGITWMGEEFEAQPESQLVGSIQIGYRF
ncbi:MAG: lipid A-modifier LpxR family protein [Mangrovicoccus sp.]